MILRIIFNDDREDYSDSYIIRRFRFDRDNSSNEIASGVIEDKEE